MVLRMTCASLYIYYQMIMCKLEHVIRNTTLSTKVIVAVFERWIIYVIKTAHSFVNLIAN